MKKDALSLRCVLGLNVLNNSAFVTRKGNVYYPAGCILVAYNTKEASQKSFFTASRAISCVAVSNDGKFIAIGERGHNPSIIIWDATTQQKISSLSGHEYGISGLAFSPNGHLLVSVGFLNDKQIILWEWIVERKIATHSTLNKVNGIVFNDTGEFFVTYGIRHMKWWYFEKGPGGEVSDIFGKPGTILEPQRNATFVDAVCGRGVFEDCVYSCTTDGILCMFDEKCSMEKWIQLDSPTAYCLTQTTDSIFVGGADGLIRCFSSSSLEYVSKLPQPSSLPNPLIGSVSGGTHPACYALRVVQGSGTTKLAAVYADHSMFIWDIADLNRVSRNRSFIYHHACIWDLAFIESHSLSTPASDSKETVSNPMPSSTFITCSADNTIRFWNLELLQQRQSKWRSPYSREMLHCIPVSDPDDESMQLESSPSGNRRADEFAPVDLSCGIPDFELPGSRQEPCTPRALAVHPNGREIVIGDRRGKLRVFGLHNMSLKHECQAHDAEVLTLSYSPPLVYACPPNSTDGNEKDNESWVVDFRSVQSVQPSPPPTVLLASAGRDRLIHILDASQDYAATSALDMHSSSVTTVKFSSDGQRLISCSGDKTVTFCGVNGPNIRRLKTAHTPKGTVNGFATLSMSKFAVSCGQDRRLSIWNVDTGNRTRSYKHDALSGELYKCDVDPAGIYVAASSFDKSIRLFDFFSGAQLAQVAGHSELITNLKFSPDGMHLVSVGGDGCIFVWQVGESLVAAMKERMLELCSNATSSSASINSHSNADMKPFEVRAPKSDNLSSDVGPATGSDVSGGPMSSGPGASSRKSGGSRWSERLEDSGGYVLFGRKITADTKGQPRRKLTLEVTNLLSLDGKADTESERATRIEAEDNVMLGEGVLVAGADLEEVHDTDPDYADDFEPDVGDGMFGSDEGRSQKSSSSTREEDGLDLHVVKLRIDELESTALKLEDWLDVKLRQDVSIDSCYVDAPSGGTERLSGEAIPGSSKSTQDFPDPAADLSKSLTSKYLRERGTLPRSDSKADTRPVPVTSSSLDEPRLPHKSLETKRKETLAAVQQMRDRLRVMGVYGATGGSTHVRVADDTPAETGNDESVDDDDATASTVSECAAEDLDAATSEAVMPPPPPTMREEEDTDRLLSDASKVNSDDCGDRVAAPPSKQLSPAPTLLPPGPSPPTPMKVMTAGLRGASAARAPTATLLRAHAEKCRETLSDLMQASSRAWAAYEELLQLKSSMFDQADRDAIEINGTSRNMTLENADTEAPGSEVVELADEVLSDFRTSWAQLTTTASTSLSLHPDVRGFERPAAFTSNLGSTRASPEAAVNEDTKRASSTMDGLVTDTSLSLMLEKYSDQLLNLVSDKMAQKMSR